MKKRPSHESIRKAFAEHLTVDVEGYEETVWDILNWVGIEDVILFLQDLDYGTKNPATFCLAGVHVDYEHMSTHNLEESIKQMGESK